MRKSIASFALFALLCTNLSAAPSPSRSQLRENYIEQFRTIAIDESIRTGIPASIKLAQGILESGNGQSRLSLMSNNHFGIKWRSSSDGEYVESLDDDKDKKGKIILSKFVKYNSPEESFRQHSAFLMRNSIYRILFTYDRTDYRSWAYGLKKAGYATDPKYAERLIQIIETNNLDRFDIPTQLSLEDTPQYSNQTNNELIAFEPEVDPAVASRLPFPTQVTKKVRVENKIENRVEKRVVQQEISPVENAEDNEEHVLFEITYASKSVKNISNPVPKRQKK